MAGNNKQEEWKQTLVEFLTHPSCLKRRFIYLLFHNKWVVVNISEILCSCLLTHLNYSILFLIIIRKWLHFNDPWPITGHRNSNNVPNLSTLTRAKFKFKFKKSFLISNDHTTSPVCREHVSISNLGVSSNYTSNVITVLEY